MSQFDLSQLSKFTKPDRQKQKLIDELLVEEDKAVFQLRSIHYSLGEPTLDAECELCEIEPLEKYCPECGRKYAGDENFCFDCLVNLKDIKEFDVRDIEVTPRFGFEKSADFSEILTVENLKRIDGYKLSNTKFRQIIKNIKLKALTGLDETIKENEIDMASLTILDKIILFSKSFVNLEYKSYGRELGSYMLDTIYIDDRQLDALQITTMMHELSHFLLNEMLTEILCLVIGCERSKEIASIVTFILSSSDENCLIDEYCAHTVEGRFTLFGYQDYSSFVNIQKSLDRSGDEIEMIKTIGNSFANEIKKILESFIDAKLLRQIKDQFKSDVIEQPDYRSLTFETCTLLNPEGLLKAIHFILLDGFAASMENIEQLNEINDMW